MIEFVRLSARFVFPSRFSIASRTISRERPWSNIKESARAITLSQIKSYLDVVLVLMIGKGRG